MDDYDLLLSDFYYYLVGDKTTYNQELNDLFVCYTLTRGLQRHCDHPRRPALPLEIILRITRHAGFIDPKPDLLLTSSVDKFASDLLDDVDTEFFISFQLSRAQLASMARLQLVSILKTPQIKVTIFPPILVPYFFLLILNTSVDRKSHTTSSTSTLRYGGSYP